MFDPKRDPLGARSAKPNSSLEAWYRTEHCWNCEADDFDTLPQHQRRFRRRLRKP